MSDESTATPPEAPGGGASPPPAGPDEGGSSSRWRGRLSAAAAWAVSAALAGLLIHTSWQSYREGLPARHLALAFTGGSILLAGALARRLPPWRVAHLLVVAPILLVGTAALVFGPEARGALAVGPLSLVELVDLLILLCLAVALGWILRSFRASFRARLLLAGVGALLALPFAYGLARGFSLPDLLRGADLLSALPWALQPALLGVVLLPPVLLLFLLRDLVRALRNPRRSAFHAALHVVSAAVPLALGLAAALEQPRAGVDVRIFGAPGWTASPEMRRADTVALDPAPEGAVWAEFEGRLRTERAGRHEFRFTGADAAELYLDGLRVLAGSEGSAELEAGSVDLRAVVHLRPGEPLRLEWRPPGETAFEPVAPRHLSRRPGASRWRRTPRQAAQVGIEWLQSASLAWQRRHRCFGCHVQAQVLMGLDVARANDYRISEVAFEELARFVRESQNEDGTWHNNAPVTATQYGAMGLAHAGPEGSAALRRAVDWLLRHQRASGELPIDRNEPPIDQGSIMTTHNALVAFQAAEASGRLEEALARGLDFVARAPVETTQDRVFQILTLVRHGDAAARARARELAAALLDEQLPDGSWRETPRLDGGNAYATGQVLYALKRAGVSVASPAFLRGVRFLLEHQRENGSWPAEHTQTHRPSEFAPTMWAVIGLAGSFGEVIPEIEAPPDGGAVAGAVELRARVANLSEAPIARARFEVDGRPVGEGTAAPGQETWSLRFDAGALPDGEHRLRVVAENEAGRRGEAESSFFTGRGLRVAWIRPGADARLGREEALAARVEPLRGQRVRAARFLVDGEPVAEFQEPSPPRLEARLDTRGLSPGWHELEVRATDELGEEARDAIRVRVPEPLRVHIVAPGPGASVTASFPCTARVEGEGAAALRELEWSVREDAVGSVPAERLAQPGPFEIPCDVAGFEPGPAELQVTAVDAEGHRAADAIPIRIGEERGPGYLRVVLENRDDPEGGQVLTFPPDWIEIVLDLSGSMWGQIDVRAKVEIAREVLARLLGELPESAGLGVRVYGHRRKGDCEDTELLAPPGSVSREEIVRRVNALKPLGKTPIAFALREAGGDLGSLPGSKVILLVTDGIESCGGDPVAAASELIAGGLDVRVHVVGFDLGDAPEAVEQLREVARAGRGSFALAENAEELRGALDRAVRLRYAVLDEAGSTVVERPLGPESNELPSGSYRVRVDAEPPLELEEVAVKRGETTTVRVVHEGGALRLEVGP